MSSNTIDSQTNLAHDGSRSRSRTTCGCVPKGLCKKYGNVIKLGILLGTPVVLLPLPLVIKSQVSIKAMMTSIFGLFWAISSLHWRVRPRLWPFLTYFRGMALEFGNSCNSRGYRPSSWPLSPILRL